MKKVFHQGEDVDFTVETLKPNVTQEKTVTYPLTLLYLSLTWCGFALKYSEKNLGINHITLLLQKHSQKTACLLNFMLHSQRQLRIKF